MLSEILKNNNLTIKMVCEGTGIPRSTIADLVSGKTDVKKMSAGNLFLLSKYLQIDMQSLYVYVGLPGIEDDKIFIEQENEKIIDEGLKVYVTNLSDNNLVETTYALKDQIRFQKYMSAIRDYYKYRRLVMPERFVGYLTHLNQISADLSQHGDYYEILLNEQR